MWKLAQAKSKVWGISPEEAYESFIHPSEFNYRRWYNLASQDELDNTLTNGDAHWMDVFGKTVGANTFSNESPYSGYSNPYNPKGITGGTWTGRLGIDEYIPSESQIDNDWPLNKAWFAIDRGNKYYQEKISKGEDTHEVPSIMTYNNGVMLPEITVTPRGNYIEHSPYANGGQEEILNKVNSSNTNFAQRLKDPDRKSIPDWESPTDRISTHKLSVGTDENGNHYIFPEVQEINGELIDFTKPPYPRFAGEISAEMRGDTVRVSSLEDAVKFTETYKQYYPFSTGGPLYPFSFEKNPYFKTPAVRYDEGGQKHDASNPGGYTNTQLAKNSSIQGWYDPTGGLNFINYVLSQNFGNMARGEENEYWKEYLGLPSAVPLMNSNANTEWDKKIEQEKIAKGELASDFYGTTPRMDYNIQALADTLMLGEMVRNYEKYDQEYNLPSIKSLTEAYEQAKTILNNPNKWTQVDGEIEVNNWPFNPNISESNPLGMLANFGMKWVPEENALYMHDTYDFPKKVHKRTEIPVRPKEMKIRSRISFDPTKGSWLLRSSDNYNTNIPSKVTK